jgi:hypothetical protein
LINSLTDSTERIKPPSATLTLVKEVPDSPLAAGESCSTCLFKSAGSVTSIARLLKEPVPDVKNANR